MCNTFDHIASKIIIPLCIMRKVSLERYYFVLYNHGALTLKMSKMALNPFCNKPSYSDFMGNTSALNEFAKRPQLP